MSKNKTDSCSRKRAARLALLLSIPVCVLGGAMLFPGKSYAFVSLLVALLVCSYFFLSFEEHSKTPARLVLVAVMTVLSVAGRFVFAALPGFKPVTAVVVLAGMYLGAEAGFMCGAFSAFLSNFYFGQGPWTPFQMLAWGLLGWLAGLLAQPLCRSKIMLCLYGVFAGVSFSMLMDVWTVLWIDNTFHVSRYAAAILSALPFTVIYAVSNVIFLLLLGDPLGKRLAHVVKKFGLESKHIKKNSSRA